MSDIKNIFAFTRLYRRTKRGTGLTGSLVRISLRPISAGSFRVLTHVTVENPTTSFTKVRLGISHVGSDYFLDELQNILADELCVSRTDILLGEGDYFFAELTGTTTGDILILNCIGWDGEI